MIFTLAFIGLFVAAAIGGVKMSRWVVGRQLRSLASIEAEEDRRALAARDHILTVVRAREDTTATSWGPDDLPN